MRGDPAHEEAACPLGLAAVLTWAATPATAAIVIIGSTMQVVGINFPTAFSQNVTVSTSPQPINGSLLQLTTQITPTGGNGEWADFALSTASGGPLAGNINPHCHILSK